LTNTPKSIVSPLLSASNTASVKEFNVALLIVAIQQPYQSFDVLLLLFFLVVASASVVAFAASAFPQLVWKWKNSRGLRYHYICLGKITII
jgi:hypothetical protein